MNTEIIFDHNSELVILAEWLSGRHREDIALLPAELFRCRNLYGAAKDGSKTLVQLTAEKIPAADGVELSDLFRAADPIGGGGPIAEASYSEAKARALLDIRGRILARLQTPGPDLMENVAELTRIQNAIDAKEIKPATANLSEILISNITKQKPRLRFGKGFEQLDRITGGMRSGQLIVLAARPGTGKSCAALQIAYNVYSRGAKVLFFPLEMTTAENLERLVLQNQIVDSQAALAAPTKQDIADITAFLDDLEATSRLLFYEGQNSLESIEQIIREQRPEFVVLDQLTQIRTARKTKDIRERYVEVTAALKAFALKYDTTILLLSQLNRPAAEKSKPGIENLAESDATGQNADMVIVLAKEEENDFVNMPPGSENVKTIDFIIAKNRGGASDRTIQKRFHGNRFTFYPINYTSQ